MVKVKCTLTTGWTQERKETCQERWKSWENRGFFPKDEKVDEEERLKDLFLKN